jgi:hypothetical protein
MDRYNQNRIVRRKAPSHAGRPRQEGHGDTQAAGFAERSSRALQGSDEPSSGSANDTSQGSNEWRKARLMGTIEAEIIPRLLQAFRRSPPQAGTARLTVHATGEDARGTLRGDEPAAQDDSFRNPRAARQR